MEARYWIERKSTHMAQLSDAASALGNPESLDSLSYSGGQVLLFEHQLYTRITHLTHMY